MSDDTENERNPTERSTQRWENEGGAPKGSRAKGSGERSQGKNAETADMAISIIDRLADSSATPEQQESRKRRLLRGPKEFRELRRDQRK